MGIRPPHLLGLATWLAAFVPSIAADSASGRYSIRSAQFISAGGNAVSENYTQRASLEGLLAGDAGSSSYQNVSGGQAPLQEIADNLISNGSFEHLGGGFVPDINQIMSLPAGSGVIPGWTMTDAESIWASNASPFPPRTSFGSYSIDLTGYHDAPPYAGVAQTVNTVAGQTYRLTFSLGTYEDDSRYQGPVTVRVTVADAVRDFTFTPDGPGNQWQTFSHDFTAIGATSMLQIVGLGASGGALLLLDNIAVVSTVPQLEFTAFERLGSDLHFTWRTRPGLNYELERRLDLEAGTWQKLAGSETQGEGTIARFTIPNGFSGERSFFRVAQPD